MCMGLVVFGNRVLSIKSFNVQMKEKYTKSSTLFLNLNNDHTMISKHHRNYGQFYKQTIV